MTLAASTRYKLYQPTVSTTDYNVPFPIFDSADLEVFVDGVVTTDFTVNATFSSGVSTDAVVVLDSGVQDVDVEIYGDRDPRRESDYLGNSPNLAYNLQKDADSLTAVQQEQKRNFQSTIRVSAQAPIASPLSGDAASRADRAIMFSPDGTGLILGPEVDEISEAQGSAQAAAVSQAAAAASAAAAAVSVAAVAATIYLDPANGSDSNSGLAPNNAVATFATALALLDVGGDLKIMRGSRFMIGQMHIDVDYVGVGAYGFGRNPIIDGSHECTGTWTQDGTYTNTWYLDVTLPEATTGDYASNSSSAWHPALFDEGVADTERTAAVERVLDDDAKAPGSVTSQADLLAVVDANPGTFTVFKQGSSGYEPRATSENGTAFRFYFNPRDGSNPNTNGRTVYTPRFISPFWVERGARVEDITVQRCSTKDMVLVSSDDAIKAEYFKRCEFLSPGLHGTVAFATQMEDCKAVRSWCHKDSRVQGGGGLHQYYPSNAATIGQVSNGVLIKNCEVEGFLHALYSHGDGGALKEHGSYDVDGLIVRDAQFVFTAGDVVRQPVLRRVLAYDVDTVCDMESEGRTFEDCEFYGTGSSPIAVSYDADERVTFRRCFLHNFSNIADAFLSGAGITQSQYPTVTLIDTTVDGTFTDPGNSDRERQNLVLENSIIRHFPTDWISGTITADATSSVEFELYSRESFATDHAGVNAGVLTGARDQTFKETIAADDLGYWDTTRNATFTDATDNNGDGTADLNINWIDSTSWGRYVRVVDAYGAGLDYEGRVTAISGTGPSHTVTVTPVPTSDFATKNLSVGYYNHDIFKDDITAKISQDGTQLNVPDGGKFCVGMLLNVGKPYGSGSFGLREVTAVSTNIVTLDTACEWAASGSSGTYNNIDGTGGKRVLPDVTVSFGFPCRKRSDASHDTPKLTVVKTEGGTITNRPATNGYWFNTGDGGLWYSRDTDGNTIDLYGGYNPEGGYIETGFGLAVGDAITMDLEVEVACDRLNYLADPGKTNSYLPDTDCAPVARGAGYPGRQF